MTPDREEHWMVKAFRLGSAGALLLSQAGCLPRGQKNPDASPPPTTSSEITPAISPPVTSPATEISPSSGVGETIVIAEQQYMSQQEVLAIDPLVESKFREFQEEIKANNPSATFAAWGALATAQTGETYFTPFFEVYNDGNLISEYVNIGKIDGSIATIELKPGEVEGPDGKIYVGLSQTVNADTNELLETPWPYIWIPYSRAEYNALSDDEKAKVPVYFSAIPGIVPQNEAPVYGGAKTANIRMIIATSEAPLPEEFLSQIPADYVIANGQVLVDGQAWFEINSTGEWQKSDWKLITDAPNQNFWEGKYKIERVLRQDIWPVLTGENLEVIKEINGQSVVIKGRLGVIPNPYQPGKILTILVPYRYEWGNGLFNNVWVFIKNEQKNPDYFLQLLVGEQIRIVAAIDSLNKPAECTFGTLCGWDFDIADLSADFFLNNVTPDEPVIVSPVYIEVK